MELPVSFVKLTIPCYAVPLGFYVKHGVFLQFQEKLQKRIVSLRNKRNLVQEDMAEYELSVRQYQRMEQDPTAIVSLWQLYKIAKAHNLEIDELLRLD